MNLFNKNKRFSLICFILAIILFSQPIFTWLKVNYTATLNYTDCINGESNEISIIFRNDDISQNTNIKFESEVLKIFNKYKIKPIYAVIPMVGGEILDNDSVIYFIKDALKNDQIVIALHGLDHKVNKYGKGEFKGLPYNVQYNRIKAGKHIVDSLTNSDVKIFVPPWNAADRNTVLASLSNGISCFSGYLYDPFIQDIYYMPVIVNLFAGPLGSLNDAFYKAKSNSFPKTLSVLFHSSYDFDEQSLNQLDSLLSKLHSKNRVVFPDPAIVMNEDSSYLHLVNKKYARFFELSKNFFERVKIISFFDNHLSIIDLNKKRDIIINNFKDGIVKGIEVINMDQAKKILSLSLYILLFQRFLLLIASIVYLRVFTECELTSQVVFLVLLLLLIISAIILINIQFISKPLLTEIVFSLFVLIGISLYGLSVTRL